MQAMNLLQKILVKYEYLLEDNVTHQLQLATIMEIINKMHFYFHLHFTGATTLINQAISTFPQKDKLLGEQEQNKTYRVCQKFPANF